MAAFLNKELKMQKQKCSQIVSGALYDFVGFLTTRKERVVASSSDEAPPVLDALVEFLAIRNIPVDVDPLVTTWQDYCETDHSKIDWQSYAIGKWVANHQVSIREGGLTYTIPRGHEIYVGDYNKEAGTFFASFGKSGLSNFSIWLPISLLKNFTPRKK